MGGLPYKMVLCKRERGDDRSLRFLCVQKFGSSIEIFFFLFPIVDRKSPCVEWVYTIKARVCNRRWDHWRPTDERGGTRNSSVKKKCPKILKNVSTSIEICRARATMRHWMATISCVGFYVMTWTSLLVSKRQVGGSTKVGRKEGKKKPQGNMRQTNKQTWKTARILFFGGFWIWFSYVRWSMTSRKTRKRFMDFPLLIKSLFLLACFDWLTSLFCMCVCGHHIRPRPFHILTRL